MSLFWINQMASDFHFHPVIKLTVDFRMDGRMAVLPILFIVTLQGHLQCKLRKCGLPQK